MSIRPVKSIVAAKPTIEGAGVKLRRAFGFGETSETDPFLLFDDFRNDRPDDYLAGLGSPEVEAIEREFVRKFGRYTESRTSMWQDVANGRPTEIDHMNGAVVAKGREAGVPTPLNAAVVEMVKEIERGDRVRDVRAVTSVFPELLRRVAGLSVAP